MSRLGVTSAVLLAMMVAIESSAAAATSTEQRAPTLKAQTSVGGEATPVPAASGSWTWQRGAWTVKIRSTSLPSGTTRVVSTWRSPTIAVRPDVPFFAVDIEDSHQGSADESSRYVDKARVCMPNRGCDRRWTSESADRLPQQFTGGFPYQVTFGHGMKFASAKAGRIYIEWRFVQTETGADTQTAVLTVAVGQAAKSV
jgi:hypothetical protein